MRLTDAWPLLVALMLALSGCMGGDDAADDTGDGGDGTDNTTGDDNTTSGDTTDPGDEPADGDDNATGGDDTSGDTGDNSTDPEPAQTVDLSVSTTGQYPASAAYDPAALEAPAGAIVNLTLTNADSLPVAEHDWVLEDVDGAATDTVAHGESTSVTFTAPLEPGEYVFFCSIGDHREQGMEGTFTVT